VDGHFVCSEKCWKNESPREPTPRWSCTHHGSELWQEKAKPGKTGKTKKGCRLISQASVDFSWTGTGFIGGWGAEAWFRCKGSLFPYWVEGSVAAPLILIIEKRYG
jgi:hypothetical protein